jgi:hypothetical protein
VVVPLTTLCVAAAGIYIVTGENPADLWDDFSQDSTRIEMPMPVRPGAEAPDASLMSPPAAQQAGRPAEVPAPALAPAPAPAPTPPSGDGKLPQVSLPTVPPPAAVAATPPTEAPPPSVPRTLPEPPAIGEPAVPPSGDTLPQPTFAQLPARVDLKPLAPAPANDLLRNSPAGPLPIAAAGREPRSVYARPFTQEGNQPRIAVIVTDLGMSRDATEAAIAKLPPAVSLSFSPYAANLDSWVKKARAAGHEVLLDLPLEPPNYPIHDSGPLAILASQGPVEAIAHLEGVMAKTTAYVGLAASLRSPVAAREQWAPLLHDVKSRGLLLVGDGLTGVPAADTPASLSVALVADETPFRAAIDAKLGRLTSVALKDGAAVTYVSAHPVTFERLLAWFESLPKRGVVLAPVSAVVRTAS